ncbi:hypothetical protein NPIL_295981 [Nephila pilipes]|uniref:Uncharacterized protein n=1 Tax=Nephila pilipes TaxID=299642 RepID=A0A8X6PGK4_NEPPI|nr:hypothetical protein NPIL_295981 [Nephila pilipes]
MFTSEVYATKVILCPLPGSPITNFRHPWTKFGVIIASEVRLLGHQDIHVPFHQNLLQFSKFIPREAACIPLKDIQEKDSRCRSNYM